MSGAETDLRRGNAANLRPASTSEEARERGRRGGIASGEARRRRAGLRDALSALLSVEGVADGIAVAMCSEARRGNVGAFKAIAQVMGELSTVVELPDLPPPVVIGFHDSAFVERERERQRREFAEIVEAAEIETSPAPPSPEPAETDIGATQTRPGVSDGEAPTDAESAPVAPSSAPVARLDLLRALRRPRTPSEARAMRREREAEKQPGGGAERTAGGARTRPYTALPAMFPKR